MRRKKIKRKDFERRKTDKPADPIVLAWLTIEKEPKTFKQIREFLKETRHAFVNMDEYRSGLSVLLKRLIKQKKIKKLDKDSNHAYPRYTAFENTSFAVGLDGNLFRTESTASMFRDPGWSYGEEDIEKSFRNKKTKQTIKEKKIETLVTYLGIQMFYTILRSYERPLNPNLSSEKNSKNRDAWLKNALSYHESNVGIIDLIVPLIAKHDKNIIPPFENKIVSEEIFKLEKTLCEMYPRIMKNIKETENHLEDVKDLMKDSYLDIPILSERILE
jgi:hypothetical protein